MSIFRKYDIRGTYGKDLTENIMRRIGNGFSTVSKENQVVVGMDTRTSSPSLKKAFLSGLKNKHVIDIGMLPISAALFAAWKERAVLAYITASHLEKEHNGVKFYHSNTIGFSEKEIQDIDRLGKDEKGDGVEITTRSPGDILESYINHYKNQIKLDRKIHVLIDCGNGATSIGIHKLFTELGFDCDVINDEPDGEFPSRSPDPISDSLDGLKSMVSNYDFGIAFDGDGDRVVIVDDKGRKLNSEQMSYVILDRLLQDVGGDVAANVECNILINKIAEKHGRKVVRFPVGHTFLSETVFRYNAAYGIETSGHGSIPSFSPFNDSILLGLYFGYALSTKQSSLSEIVDSMPHVASVKMNIPCPDGVKFLAMDKLKQTLEREYENIDNMDGICVNFEHGRILLRASNTEPKIRISAEGESHDSAESMLAKFASLLEEIIKEVA